MQKIHILLGLEVHTNTRLERLHEAIGEYEKICEVSTGSIFVVNFDANTMIWPGDLPKTR